jgi:hypothetical protein
MTGVMWVASRGGLLLQSLALLLSLLSLSASAQDFDYEVEKRTVERLQFYLGDPVATNQVIADFQENGGVANNINMEATDRNLKLALAYSVSQRSQFLIGDSSTAIVIYEDAEPYYLIGASTGSDSSRFFLTSDLTQPCPVDRGVDILCTPVRSSVRDMEGSPMDVVLVKAFEHHLEAGYPEDLLSISIQYMEDVEAPSIYVSQSSVIEQEGGQLAWRVIIVAPGAESTKESTTKCGPIFLAVMCVIGGLVFCIIMFAERKEKEVIVAFFRFTCTLLVCKILRNFDEPKPEGDSKKQIVKDKDEDEPKPQSNKMKCEEGFEKVIAKEKDPMKDQSKQMKGEAGVVKSIAKDEEDSEKHKGKDEDEPKPQSKTAKSEEDTEKAIERDENGQNLN